MHKRFVCQISNTMWCQGKSHLLLVVFVHFINTSSLLVLIYHLTLKFCLLLSSSSCHKATSCSKGRQGSCFYHSAIREQDFLSYHYSRGKCSSYMYSHQEQMKETFCLLMHMYFFLLVCRCGDP